MGNLGVWSYCTCSRSGFMSSSLLLLMVMAAVICSINNVEAQLVADFYKASCPNAETVVAAAVSAALNKNSGIAPGVLRMHFHDCFVRGCDGSVLIDSPSEKDAIPNLTLRGFEVIDAAKAAAEKECPGVVSCADILALAAQISVNKMSGGKITWKVSTGRRDGLVSSSAEPLAHLPSPNADVTTLKSLFGNVGLSTEQMVTLSGAHSVGVAHCGTIARRLTSPPDATLDPKYAASLQSQCPAQSTNVLNLDPTTPTKLDEVYYKNLQAKKGLLKSDQNLEEDAETQPLVAAHTQFSTFGPKFAQAMIAMGNINVLTGTAGEIRLNCRRFN